MWRCHASSGPQRRAVVISFYLKGEILDFLKANQPKQKSHTHIQKKNPQTLPPEKQPTKVTTN